MKRDYEKLFVNQFLEKKVLNDTIKKLEAGIPFIEFPDDRVVEILKKVREEPRPLRKYSVSNGVAKDIHNLLIDEADPEELKWFKTSYFRQLCKNYSGEVGLVYTSIQKHAHFIYSITDTRIQIVSFCGQGKADICSVLGSVFNIDGSLTIDPFDIQDEIVNIPDITYASGIAGLYNYAKDFEDIEKMKLLEVLVSKWRKKLAPEKTFSLEEFIPMFITAVRHSAFHKKNHKLAFTKGEIEKFGEGILTHPALEGNKSFFLTYSAMMLIFLKLSEIRTERFESIQSAGKNIPTEFINPETGKRNQGVIRVDKLYNTEITVDCPFGVRGHWRNQYCGKDSEGNPIHRLIFIEAFEKKGYHRRATKNIVEMEGA